MLTIHADIREEIRRHGVEMYPLECCGILLGVKTGDAGMAIRRIVRADNIAERAARHNRYVVDPLAILRADAVARTEGLEILGFYHSHPDHPAVPSATDHSLAWPDYIYAIGSITAAGAYELRVWHLAAAHEPMVEIHLA